MILAYRDKMGVGAETVILYGSYNSMVLWGKLGMGDEPHNQAPPPQPQ